MSQGPNNDQLTNKMPKNVLGKTGRKLSIIGFGGIVVMNAEPEHVKKLVAEAVEKGINYFDVIMISEPLIIPKTPIQASLL